MPKAPWSKSQRDQLRAIAGSARTAYPAWSEARDDFVPRAAKFMRWSMEADAWPKRKRSLEDLFETFHREASKSPVLVVSGAPIAPRELGFWERRDLRRQLERTKLFFGAEVEWEGWKSMEEGRPMNLDAFSPERLKELEREVYRRFGLEP